MQAVAVVQPFFGDGGGEDGPVCFGFNPVVQTVLHLGLFEEQVFRFAHFQIGGTRDGRAGVDQVFGIKLLGAIVALIAACVLKPAIGAGAFNIAVGEEAAIGLGVNLGLVNFFDQPFVSKCACEMLGQFFVLLGRRAAEVVEAEAKSCRDVTLHGIHLSAIFLDRFASFCRGQLGGGAVLIGGAKEQDFVTAGAQVAGIEISWQLAAHQIAEVLDPVDIGNGGSDEVTCHDMRL